MNEIIKIGLTLMIVTLIAGTALAVTNYYTAEKIGLQKGTAVTESLNAVIDADSFEDKVKYFEAYKDGRLVGKVVKIGTVGYSSIIQAVVGYGLDNKITGIDIIEQKETPGLGANIEKEPFLKQFIGKTKDELVLSKDGGQIDAITGATISSRALVDGIRYDYDNGKSGTVKNGQEGKGEYEKEEPEDYEEENDDDELDDDFEDEEDDD